MSLELKTGPDGILYELRSFEVDSVPAGKVPVPVVDGDSWDNFSGSLDAITSTGHCKIRSDIGAKAFMDGLAVKLQAKGRALGGATKLTNEEIIVAGDSISDEEIAQLKANGGLAAVWNRATAIAKATRAAGGKAADGSRIFWELVTDAKFPTT